MPPPSRAPVETKFIASKPDKIVAHHGAAHQLAQPLPHPRNGSADPP
jgi:hypothetical protein